jgi:hypothetical protein
MTLGIWAYLAAAGVAAIAGVSALNYSGFCFSQGRFLAHAELIEIAARDYFRQYPPLNYTGFTAKAQKPIAYASFEDFTARNPECCSITRTGRDGGAPSPIESLLGRFAGFVRIEYRLEDDVPGAPATNVVHVAMTNCGVPWNGIKLR